ncbi:MAG: glycosyltransferase family 4 protein [Actinomycetales bacterium]|nr:glycosyltransferase family 4 protein [Actinomycetales bacterium]
MTLATNNGDIGGGEVMLLNIAQALRDEGIETTVVGPSSPSALVEASRARGFQTVELKATSRLTWMWALRRWDARYRTGILWANGLLPSVATLGHRNRIVHLHQEPHGLLKLLEKPARAGALSTLVPSESMQRAIRGSRVFSNWVSKVERAARPSRDAQPTVVGFLGRPSLDKGVDVLAAALEILEAGHPGEFRLLLAGEHRFVTQEQQRAVEAALHSIEHLTDRPGWMTPAEFFSNVDIFVCPSVWPESFGLVVAEAMSARVPVIVSDAGALPELVGQQTHNVVASGDAAALAAKILSSRESPDPKNVDLLFQRWENLYSPKCGRKSIVELLAEVQIRS